MAITIHPKVGQILLCDFSEGFREPEMVKSGRPVVVLSPAMQGRQRLVTVVALSSARPDPVMPYHYHLPRSCLPQLGRFDRAETWVKGDMIYTVGFHRLDLIQLGRRNPNTGKRVYFSDRLGRERMREIYSCVLRGLNLSALCKHL
ncbi:MAG: type II toxin-antitoxin system PemK/MazF family toxin [Aquisalimonadaceae bacterium]